MFFDDWSGLGRVVIVGALAYLGLVAMLRVSGNRTLAQMSAFDFVVTVALGSTLATVLLSRDVSLAEGLTAFALLIGLQYAITWLSVRFPVVEMSVKSEPRLLVQTSLDRRPCAALRACPSDDRCWNASMWLLVGALTDGRRAQSLADRAPRLPNAACRPDPTPGARR